MTRYIRALLFTEEQDLYWQEMLAEVFVPLGTLQVVSENEGICRVLLGNYNLIIIDAAMVKNVPLLVARIRAQQPEARVIVVTASPTWKRARDAFQAGATDYLRKSHDRVELLAAVQAALEKTLPPWP